MELKAVSQQPAAGFGREPVINVVEAEETSVESLTDQNLWTNIAGFLAIAPH